MSVEQDSNYTFDSSQLQEFLYQLDQVKHHQHQLEIALYEALGSLHLAKRHISYIKEEYRKLADRSRNVRGT